ncbi:MAG TPA: permease [Oscillospiraceae bacterium]|nr:permease [Oscillospiraceae bacterium]
MKKTIIVMSAAVVVLSMLAYLQGGTALVGAGFLIGVRMMWSVLPMLVAAFALNGLVQVLVNRDKITTILGKSAGVKGMLLGSLGGGLLPGGPYVVYPLISSFMGTGADAATIMALVVGKSLLDLARLPQEAAFLGTKVMAIRYGITFTFPLLAAILTKIFFPKLTEELATFRKQLEKQEEAAKE